MRFIQFITKRVLSTTKVVPEPRGNVKDVSSFLNTIKRGCENYVNKIPDWQSLFTLNGEGFEKAGVPCKQRKMIMAWVHKYRLGIDPYYIPPSQKLRLKAKKKRQEQASLRK